MKKKLLAICALLLVFCFVVTGCQQNPGNNTDGPGTNPDQPGKKDETNKYTPYTQVTNLENGMSWPEDQAFPTFATPAEVVDMISIAYFTKFFCVCQRFFCKK